MANEWEKMVSGDLYLSKDESLVAARQNAKRILKLFRDTDPADLETHYKLLKKIIGKLGAEVEIEPPFFCDYGTNISIGENFYANTNCVILDPAPVTIGNNVKFGPGVQIYTAYHPILPDERSSGYELASPVTIGNNVWIGGGAIIQPGITIGDNTVIGAGSVVTKDVPTGIVAAGVPCSFIRHLPG